MTLLLPREHVLNVIDLKPNDFNLWFLTSKATSVRVPLTVGDRFLL